MRERANIAKLCLNMAWHCYYKDDLSPEMNLDGVNERD